MPVLDQREGVGHAVRAGYLYSAMADVGALTGDPAFGRALDALWESVVFRKLDVTGGLGARRDGEAFGDDCELPSLTAYAETCAPIAGAMWNHRMFRLRGEAKYVDVLERILYNGFLSGVSLDGERFFYPNPLAATGTRTFNQGKKGRSVLSRGPRGAGRRPRGHDLDDPRDVASHMFQRIVVLTPPLWQIVLSIVLLALGALGVLWVAARIYRGGTLMYGKKPTFPELMRWVRHS